MNAPVQPPQSLLTLTEPKQDATGVDATDDRFAEELGHAARSSEEAAADSEPDNGPDPPASANDEETAASPETERQEPVDPAEPDEQLDVELLVTTLAGEPTTPAPVAEGQSDTVLLVDQSIELAPDVDPSAIEESATPTTPGEGEQALDPTPNDELLAPEADETAVSTEAEPVVDGEASNAAPAPVEPTEAPSRTDATGVTPETPQLGDEAAVAASPFPGPRSDAGPRGEAADHAPSAALGSDGVVAVDTPEGSEQPGDDANEGQRQDGKPIEAPKPADAAVPVVDRPANDAPATPSSGAVASVDAARATPAAPTAEATAAEPSAPTVDATRFVTRVARAIDFANERGGGPIEMRLSPPELGTLQVKIELKEGVMTASMEVETPAARQTLLENLPALRDRLEQQSVRIDKFDVDVRDESQQRGGEPQQQDQAQQRPDERRDSNEPAPTQTAARETESPETEPDRPAATIDFGDDAINLVA